MNGNQSRTRRGMTLVELLVVVAILALLAGLILAKMGGILERSGSAVQAANIHDTARFIETYNALHKSYPDGWDTLVAEGGAGLYGGTSKLHPNLMSTWLSGAGVAALSATELSSINSIGINHCNYHSSAAEFPSDSGIVNGHLSDPINVVRLNVSFTAGLHGSMTPNNAVSTALQTEFNMPTNLATWTFVAFGLGPKNWAVSEVMQNAPLMDSIDAGRYYARPIAIFAVDNTADATGKIDKGQFIGVIGPDGRSLKASAADYNKQAPRDH